MSTFPMNRQQDPQKISGWGDALQMISPLALSMAQGIRSGRGAAFGLPQGVEAMQAMQERNAQKAAEDQLAQAADTFGMSPLEKALFDSMDLNGKQGLLGQLAAQRRADARRGGGAAQTDWGMWNDFLNGGGGGESTPLASSMGMSMGSPDTMGITSPQAMSGGLSFGRETEAQPLAGPMPNAAPNAMASDLSFGSMPQPQAQQAQPPGPPARDLNSELRMIESRMGQVPLGVPGADSVLSRLKLRRDMILDEMKRTEQAKQPEAEQELERLQSIGMSYEEAVKLKEGVYKVITDPVTKEAILFDVQTRQAVRPIEEPQPQPQEQSAPEFSFGNRFGDAPSAFGPEGFARNLINTGAEMVGGSQVYPETGQAISDFNVMRESMLNKIAGAYQRQPPAFLLKSIQDNIPSAANPFKGPEDAQQKLRALGRDFQSEQATLQKRLSHRLSPTDRAAAQSQLGTVESAIQQISDALGAFSPETQSTANGVQWRIVD